MDGETIITWNPENWLTVVLMAMLGFMVIGFAGQLVRRATAPSTASAGDGSNVVALPGMRA